MPKSRRRSATTKTQRRGAQPGNSNARTHGVYAAPLKPLTTITDILLDAQARQAQLSAYIDEAVAEGLDTDAVVKLFGLHAQNASRLGRLLRDQRALTGGAAEGLTAAIAAALDELNTELGRTDL